VNELVLSAPDHGGYLVALLPSLLISAMELPIRAHVIEFAARYVDGWAQVLDMVATFPPLLA
jgi:hypothetical protein